MRNVRTPRIQTFRFTFFLRATQFNKLYFFFDAVETNGEKKKKKMSKETCSHFVMTTKRRLHISLTPTNNMFSRLLCSGAIRAQARHFGMSYVATGTISLDPK